MLRFVILRHDLPPGQARPSHWDFMLEVGETLKTWALSQPPDASLGDEPIEAERLPCHRLAYLTYEGPVSGDRGSVTRWDQGDYRLVSQRDDEWIVELHGARLVGIATLRRGETADDWQWTFAPRGKNAAH